MYINTNEVIKSVFNVFINILNFKKFSFYYNEWITHLTNLIYYNSKTSFQNLFVENNSIDWH